MRNQDESFEEKSNQGPPSKDLGLSSEGALYHVEMSDEWCVEYFSKDQARSGSISAIQNPHTQAFVDALDCH